MKKYSIPADFNVNDIARLHELNNNGLGSAVTETYGQVTVNGNNSGRSLDVLPPIGLNQLEKYVKQLTEHDIDFNYTLNSSCLSNDEFTLEFMYDTRELIKNLWDIGVKKITIALPAVIELVKSIQPDMEIKASAICEINTPYKALFYKKLGADRVVVDPDITRRFGILRSICQAFGAGVEIIATNACRCDCPYKMFHYNFTAHKSLDSNDKHILDYYDNRCFLQHAEENTVSLKLNWIRPEDIHYYDDIGISSFKIDGRQHILQGDYIKTLLYYFEEKFDGNLFELIHFFDGNQAPLRYLENRNLDGFIEPFFNGDKFCNGICDTCQHCVSFLKRDPKAISAARASKIMFTQVRNADKYIKSIQQGDQDE